MSDKPVKYTRVEVLCLMHNDVLHKLLLAKIDLRNIADQLVKDPRSKFLKQSRKTTKVRIEDAKKNLAHVNKMIEEQEGKAK